MTKKVIPLFEGDPRCETLFQALLDVVYERAIKMPIPSIIGTIELVKYEIMQHSMEEK